MDVKIVPVDVPLRADFEKQEDSVVCPICRDGVNNPLITDCGHIFCKRCLLKAKKTHLACPVCRSQLKPELTCFTSGWLGSCNTWLTDKQPDRLLTLLCSTMIVAVLVFLWYLAKKILNERAEGNKE